MTHALRIAVFLIGLAGAGCAGVPSSDGAPAAEATPEAAPQPPLSAPGNTAPSSEPQAEASPTADLPAPASVAPEPKSVTPAPASGEPAPVASVAPPPAPATAPKPATAPAQAGSVATSATPAKPPAPATSRSTDLAPSPTPGKPAATAAVAATRTRPTAAAPAAPTHGATTAAPARPATKPLDLASLEKRLRETRAIGVMTKLSLKNQVDDLLDKFRAHYRKQSNTTLAELRRPYDMLLLKVLSLLQDSDPTLARDIVASREAIWGILADPDKFTKANLMAGVTP